MDFILYLSKYVSMKSKTFKLICAIIIFVNSSIMAQSPQFDWVKSIGGPNGELGYSIDVDHLGNVYTTGFFTGIADFDPSTGVFNLSSDVVGSNQIFISKLSQTGAFLWAKKIYPSSNSFGQPLSFLKIDNSGNVFVLFNDSVTKITSSGNVVWSKFIGGTVSNFTIDNYENLIITGEFNGLVDFNSGLGVDTLRSQGIGPKDIFVLKLDNNGNFIWVKSIGCINTFFFGNFLSFSTSIAVSALGNIYITGQFQGVVDFNPGVLTYTLGSAPGYNHDMFLLNLNNAGDFVWAKSTNSGWIQSLSIAIDANENVYTTGEFFGTVNFPSNTLYSISSGGSDFDVFVSKFDATGNVIWAKRLGGTGIDIGRSLNLDGSNNVCIMGDFQGTGYFNPGSGFTMTANGGNNDHDVFLVNFDYNGNFIWANSFGGANAETCFDMVNDTLGNIFLTGMYSGTCDFDPSASTYTIVSQVASSDAFVLKLGNSVIGVQEHNKDDYIAIYPNPNNGRVRVNSSMEGSYQLINIFGQTIKTLQLDATNNFTVTIDDLPQGIYTLVGKENNQAVSQKIIVIE